MAARLSISGVRDLGRKLSASLGTAAAVSSESIEMPSIDSETLAIFNYKKEALAMAKEAATERGDGIKPTMTDYFIAAQKVGEIHAEEMANNGIRWTPAVISDLSSLQDRNGKIIATQVIDGFQINKADMEPPREALLLASQRARDAAQASGNPVTLTSTLQELQKIQQSNEKLPSLASLEDMMDLDGNGTIAFYEAVGSHSDFKGTIFSNSSFHPAGTLMYDNENNNVAVTDGAQFKSCVFDGMGPDDSVTLARGTYSDIEFTNIRGGGINIADGTQIDGMDLRGAHASLSIGRASVSNLDASGAHIVTLDAAPGAEIHNAKFVGTTIDMASELQGSKWSHITCDGANLGHVNMCGAEINNFAITNSTVANWDLSGARINNLVIDGTPITSNTQLAALGIQVDAQTVASASPDLVMQHQLAGIRGAMQNAIASLDAPQTGASPASPTTDIATAVAALKTNDSPTRFAVEDSSLAQAMAGFNPAKDLVERTQPIEIMGRDSKA